MRTIKLYNKEHSEDRHQINTFSLSSGLGPIVTSLKVSSAGFTDIPINSGSLSKMKKP